MYRPIFLLALVSIAALPIAVKAQKGNSPSFKKDRTNHTFGIKNSIKDAQNDFTKLIQTILISGENGSFPDGFAQAIGLSQAIPRTQVHNDISHHKDKEESRECNVTYTVNDNSGRHAVSILLSRTKYTKGTMSSVYYRVNLDGQLESAITLNMKRGADGKALREGHSRIEEDIASPDTQKAFKTEMAYWLKVWLKKHRQLVTTSAK